MKPELDGRGGGYGKFAGLTLTEIQEIYDRCQSDASMRSVSIILRVAREQIEARGSLGHYPVLASISGGLLVLLAAIKGFLPEAMQASLPKILIGLGAVTLALLLGVVATWRDRITGLAQEKAICEITRDALDKVTSHPDFKAKPLDFTQNLTFEKITKGAKERAFVSRLLDR